jgi:DNA-directed RNA polymerase specialized sigma24 family protein
VREPYALDRINGGSGTRSFLKSYLTEYLKVYTGGMSTSQEVASDTVKPNPDKHYIGRAFASHFSKNVYEDRMCERADISRAFSKLTRTERTALAYRYLLDLDRAEIADALGLYYMTVSKVIARAFVRAAAILDGDAVVPAPFLKSEV